MLKRTFLVLTISLSFGVASLAENWELVADTDSKFEGIIANFDKQAAVKEKDVLQAFRDNSYEVYVDTDSIREIEKDKRNALQKVVFTEEQDIVGADKKFKYILAEMSFHCALEIIWFVNGGVYDNNGEKLRESQTVFVSVDISKLPHTSLERHMWKKVCFYQ